MSTKKTKIPNPEEVIALMAGAPISGILTGGKRPSNLKKRPTRGEVATLLDITPNQVDKVLKAWKQGGILAARKLRYGAGRPLKEKDFTVKEIEYMVSRSTMYSQAGLSLKARAKQISDETGKDIKTCELSKLYKGRGITK